MKAIFSQWGLPKAIKVDNGRPFGDPTRQGLPPLAMWLIGLGIDVIWNRPRVPQDNAKVERCQGTLANWTEYHRCQTLEELEQILQQGSHFYNYVFRDRRKKKTTRIERHPSLPHTGRRYTGQDIDEQKIAAYVGQGEWIRVVGATGQVMMTNQRFYLSRKYSRQQVSLRLDPIAKVWIVSDTKGNQIGRSPRKVWTNWIQLIRG